MQYPPIHRLVVATHNEGKLREFQDLLRPFVPEIVSAGQLGLPSPEETGTTFAQNAQLKAKAATQASGCVALADDSGLCVNALGGEPGIFSARWTEQTHIDGKAQSQTTQKADYFAAMNKIQKKLGNASDRSAYFLCVLTLYWPDGQTFSVEGKVDGLIAPTPKGEQGHGYDPIFVPDGYDLTFAEMDDSLKNKISHRGVATRALIERYFMHRETSA